MCNFSDDDLRLAEKLLHDAVLEHIAWDRQLASFAIRFNCLRRNVDGSEMEDRLVEFRLAGVQALAIGYDSPCPETRPSQFNPPHRISSDDLSGWRFRPQEVTLRINSPDCVDALEAARLDWMQGRESSVRNAPWTFCLHFDHWTDFGLPAIKVWLLAAGDSFTITSSGLTLDLADWERQFSSWWKGWREHWQTKSSRTDEAEYPDASEYDTAIPLGESEPLDLTYRPPSEPVFALGPTNLPPELIEAIAAWFSRCHGQTAEEALGRWGYGRSVDDWWVEGNRACVVVRGIEHQMPSEGDPATNKETVWTFTARKKRGIWVIDSFSQGWPVHRSAPKLPYDQKPWLLAWESGEVT